MSRFSGDGYEGDQPYALMLSTHERALKGKPGRQKLRELERALLAMPVHRLCEGSLAREGEVCAVGAMAAHRMVQLGVPFDDAVRHLADRFSDEIDEYETAEFAKEHLGTTYQVGWAISYENDEQLGGLTPEERWTGMLAWVREQLAEARP